MPNNKSDILFDKFEIIDTLKKDQHTSVYLANHIYLGKKIILKTLSTKELPDQTFLERFRREAKILAQLDHHNLIKVLDFGTAGDNFYISFEYFEGKNLRKVINEDNLSDEQKIQLSIQLFEALNAAHKNGVIHRDIKPENILVNAELELKIADFGLALARDDLFLTHKSSIVGTPGYMSPEQIRGQELTPQTDLFSSGIVIYELFTGDNPFIGNDINDTINNILNFNIDKDVKQISFIPPEVQEVLSNLLKKNSNKRIKTALEALSYFKGVKDDVPQKVDTKQIRSNKIKVTILYVSAAIIIIIALVRLFTISDNNKSVNESPVQEITNTDPKEDLNKKDNVVEKPITGTGLETKNIVTKKENNVEKVTYGELFVEANPWADVYINNRKIDTTPLQQSIQLNAGKYELKLVHPDFPTYFKTIEIQQNKLRTVKVNFFEKVGYLDCKVFPWGEIFIDGKYKVTSPQLKPIMLMAGDYNLSIRNPGYQNIEEKIAVKSSDTLTLRFTFNDSTKITNK
jgi:eukaryotic-like serine/threonine-protein kinase